MGVTQVAILKRLKAAGYIQKQGNWIPHELKPRDVERRFCMSEMLLERHKKKSFLHRIVTGDEKWIHYDNPKRKKSYVWLILILVILLKSSAISTDHEPAFLLHWYIIDW